MPIRLLLLLLPLLPTPGMAREVSGDAIPTVETEQQSIDNGQEKDILDKHKEIVESTVNRAASWVDSFFSDPNYEAESANTLLRIRPELYYRQDKGLEGRFKARVKFRLPNINRSTSLRLGVKFNEFAGYIGPRVRYAAPWGDRKFVSLTQVVRYQTNNYWNTISRADFNFILGDTLFFRQTFDGRWRGEKSDEKVSYPDQQYSDSAPGQRQGSAV